MINKMIKQQITNLDKAQAMKCFSDFTNRVERDVDPGGREELMSECNCRNCDYYQYCCKLAETLIPPDTIFMTVKAETEG